MADAAGMYVDVCCSGSVYVSNENPDKKKTLRKDNSCQGT